MLTRKNFKFITRTLLLSGGFNNSLNELWLVYWAGIAGGSPENDEI
jgi:hypothetical protein